MIVSWSNDLQNSNITHILFTIFFTHWHSEMKVGNSKQIFLHICFCKKSNNLTFYWNQVDNFKDQLLGFYFFNFWWLVLHFMLLSLLYTKSIRHCIAFLSFSRIFIWMKSVFILHIHARGKLKFPKELLKITVPENKTSDIILS